MTGRIHSIESLGTVDGPGLRFVVFFQGCPMRCLYCHNPDTWEPLGGTEMTVSEILEQFEKNRPFYRNGGLTVTGGEPLMQIAFLTELFTEAKRRKIHTCVDTSGITFTPHHTAKIDALLAVTDLILLDIKDIRPSEHRKLTGQENLRILSFARYLSERKIPVWIRHVIVPGCTDTEEELLELGHFIGTLKNVKALDVLPYHTMGELKYKKLQIPYPLKGVPECSKEQAMIARDFILQGIRETRA